MKIAEVRGIIEKYTEKQLKYIIAEMYKVIPKAVKEDNDIKGKFTRSIRTIGKTICSSLLFVRLCAVSCL